MGFQRRGKGDTGGSRGGGYGGFQRRGILGVPEERYTGGSRGGRYWCSRGGILVGFQKRGIPGFWRRRRIDTGVPEEGILGFHGRGIRGFRKRGYWRGILGFRRSWILGVLEEHDTGVPWLVINITVEQMNWHEPGKGSLIMEIQKY